MKRKIFIGALALCLVALMAAGSLAYFTSSASKTNVFRTASYDPEDPDGPDPDEVFSVVVTESDNENDGEEELDEDDKPTGRRIYSDILPGDLLNKLPRIKNTSVVDEGGEADQWIRATIVISNGEEWLEADESLNTPAKVFNALIVPKSAENENGFDASKWDHDDFDAKKEGEFVCLQDGKLVYTLYLKAKLVAQNDVIVFNKVQIPGCLDNVDFAALAEFSITVKADAIQATNTGAGARATFESTEYWTEA